MDTAHDDTNPLKIPDAIQPIRCDIDWGRRVIRFQQQESQFSVLPNTVILDFPAAKRLVAVILNKEANDEGGVVHDSSAQTIRDNGNLKNN